MRYIGRLLLIAGIISIGMSQEEKAQASSSSDRVQIEEVSVMMSEVGPVVFLKARQRMVPIFVDPTVAGSIEGALSGIKLPRPLSHDLMHTILNAYGGKVSQVVIRLKDQIYYGELTISLDGQMRVFDSRSSDAIALAIHFGAPIWVGKDLLEKAGEIQHKTEEQQVL